MVCVRKYERSFSHEVNGEPVGSRGVLQTEEDFELEYQRQIPHMTDPVRSAAASVPYAAAGREHAQTYENGIHIPAITLLPRSLIIRRKENNTTLILVVTPDQTTANVPVCFVGVV
jgi:hypothetical protein